MKRRIFHIFVLTVLAVSGHAADTNQTTVVATNKPASKSSNTLAMWAAVANANAGNSLQTVTVTTNKPAWESSVSAGLSLTKGNSDTLLATAAFKTGTKTPANEFIFGVDGAYGESDSVKNNETLHGVSQYNHLFSDRFYTFLNVEGLHDDIADLQYRFTFSPGAGYYFVKATNTTLAGEFGPGLITQRLGGVDTTYVTLRLAERFEHKLNAGARIWEKAEILPQANKLDNFLVNAEVGAEAALTKTFSLRVTLQDNFVNQPAPERKKNDVRLISGVVYKF
jgi:putative salt-induced outer membrane protein YdiY